MNSKNHLKWNQPDYLWINTTKGLKSVISQPQPGQAEQQHCGLHRGTNTLWMFQSERQLVWKDGNTKTEWSCTTLNNATYYGAVFFKFQAHAALHSDSSTVNCERVSQPKQQTIDKGENVNLWIIHHTVMWERQTLPSRHSWKLPLVHVKSKTRSCDVNETGGRDWPPDVKPNKQSQQAAGKKQMCAELRTCELISDSLITCSG